MNSRLSATGRNYFKKKVDKTFKVQILPFKVRILACMIAVLRRSVTVEPKMNARRRTFDLPKGPSRTKNTTG